MLPKSLLAGHAMPLGEQFLMFRKTVEPSFPSSSSPLFMGSLTLNMKVDRVWNVTAHAQKPHFVFRRNRWVHLDWRGCQFNGLLAAEVCASAVVMLDTPCSEVAWRVLATHCIRQFPLHFPSRVSPCAIICQLESTAVLQNVWSHSSSDKETPDDLNLQAISIFFFWLGYFSDQLTRKCFSSMLATAFQSTIIGTEITKTYVYQIFP